MMQDDDGGKLVEAIAKAINDSLIQQYVRSKRWDGAADVIVGFKETAAARAALTAIEREGWTLLPPKIEGATLVCELPRELGAVTGMRVQDDRVICDTESGIPFVLSTSPKQS